MIELTNPMSSVSKIPTLARKPRVGAPAAPEATMTAFEGDETSRVGLAPMLRDQLLGVRSDPPSEALRGWMRDHVRGEARPMDRCDSARNANTPLTH